MVIIFFDSTDDSFLVATDKEPLRKYFRDAIQEVIPEDDILYVANAHIMTRQQFIGFLDGSYDISLGHDPAPAQAHQVAPAARPKSNRRYLHTTANAPTILGDIRTDRFPEGVVLQNKYQFIPLDMIGQDALDQSAQLKIAIQKKRIEIVDDEFVQKNMHKARMQGSFRDSELNRILVPAGSSAEMVAADGGLPYADDSDLYYPSQPQYGAGQGGGQIPLAAEPQPYTRPQVPQGPIPLYREG